MTTSVQTSQDFQERLYDKIRSEIGNLMTTEEMKKLVDRTMDKMFFERRIQKNDWGRVESDKPPVIEEIVAELIQPSMILALKQYLAEHPDVVKDQIEKAFAGGIVTSVGRALDSMLAGQTANVGQMIFQALTDFKNNPGRYG